MTLEQGSRELKKILISQGVPLAKAGRTIDCFMEDHHGEDIFFTRDWIEWKAKQIMEAI